MPLDLANFELLARDAIRNFWESRGSAQRKQAATGRLDQGERAGVTAGKNLDGFIDVIEAIVRANGLNEAEIHRNRSLVTLPGYFRATKLWDVLVTQNGKLIAAIEFKSHVGPSFGNNLNNRAEEAIGTAADLWLAHREAAYGGTDRPFIGWLMVLEDCAASRKPVKTRSPHFPVFPEFNGASSANRYEVLCKKLMRERYYSAATLVLARREDASTGRCVELSEATGLRAFVASLAGHIAAEAIRNG